MPIDTTVTNGRFVTPAGISDRPLSIHHGQVLPAAELEDVWRTIDASGFLVFPGLIQPAMPSGELALAAARQGVTVALVEEATADGFEEQAAFDYLKILDITDLGRDQIDSVEGGDRRTFLCRAPRPDLNDVLADRTVIISGLALLPERWLTDATSNVIVRTGSDPLPAGWLDDIAMIQVPLSLLAEEVDLAWSFVEDESAPVHVIIDRIDIPALPLLAYEGQQQRSVSLERIAEVLSGIPAQVFDLQPMKGHFQPGGNGDLFVFDPDSDDPYRPAPWPGRTILSLQRGELLFYNGQIHAKSGAGRPLGQDA